MKNCRSIALQIYAKMEKGHANITCEIINRRLSPPECGLVALYLFDLCQPFHLTAILTSLTQGQREHFVLDSSGKVVLVFDSQRDAVTEVVRLGKGYSVISGASK